LAANSDKGREIIALFRRRRNMPKSLVSLAHTGVGSTRVADCWGVSEEHGDGSGTRAGEPKFVVLKGFGHYEVHAKPAFGGVMREATDWYRRHLPAG
jgi:hypothetical protein